MSQKFPSSPPNISTTVYIGETASLSYLQFLRRVLKHRLGPCPFTESEFNNFMLENDLTIGGNEEFNVLESGERKVLAQVYLEAVRCSELFSLSGMSHKMIQQWNTRFSPTSRYL